MRKFILKLGSYLGRVIFALLMTCVGLLGVNLLSATWPTKVTLCQLAQNPSLYKGQIIRVEADGSGILGGFTIEDEQFLKVKDSFRVDMASVTGTPLHYFLQNTRGFASGEALRKVETRFLAKVRDRQESFGQTWADLMSFALRLTGHDDVDLITNWDDPAPIADTERLQNILLKKQLGVSTEQALKEAGYGDLDIRRMLKT